MNQLSRYKAPQLDFSAPDPVEVRDADLDMTVVVRLIRRRIRFIALVAGALTLMILPVIIMLQPVYRGDARFLIQEPLVSDPTSAKTGFNLEDEVLRVSARANADRVVTQLNLAGLPEFNPNLKPVSTLSTLIAGAKAKLMGQTTAQSQEKPDPAERVLAAFYDRLTVLRQTDSIMQISFRSTDPKLAAEVPNAMIEAYLADRRASHDARIQEAMAQVDARLAAQRARVDAAAAAVSAFQKQEGIASAGRVVDIQTNQLVLLNTRQVDLQKRRADLQSKISSVDAAVAGTGPAPLEETPALTQLRQSLQQEQSELTRLKTRFGAGFAGVKTQLARVASLQTSIRDELTAWGQSMKAELAQLDDEEAKLAKNGAAAQGALSKTSLAELQLADLVRRAGVQTQIMEGIEAEKSQLEGLRSQPVFDLEMLSPATQPIWPEGRSRSVYLLLAIFASGVIAVTLAGVLELTDRTVRSPQQLAGEPGLVPVGMLPVPATPGGIVTLGERKGKHGPRLEEAFRDVLLAMENENGGLLPDSLMVTTARTDEGAGFVANGLALALVERGRNVLIVDAVTPRSRFWQHNTPGAKPGLAEYLRQEAPLMNLVTDTGFKGLHVLPRGKGTLSHLRDAERIEHILDYAAAFGHLVIFVCPPVVNNASALRIAAVVTRVMLVIGWGATPRDAVLLTSQKLRNGRVDRVLTVLNGVQPRLHALYSYRDAAAFADQTTVSGW